MVSALQRQVTANEAAAVARDAANEAAAVARAAAQSQQLQEMVHILQQNLQQILEVAVQGLQQMMLSMQQGMQQGVMTAQVQQSELQALVAVKTMEFFQTELNRLTAQPAQPQPLGAHVEQAVAVAVDGVEDEPQLLVAVLAPEGAGPPAGELAPHVEHLALDSEHG